MIKPDFNDYIQKSAIENRFVEFQKNKNEINTKIVSALHYANKQQSKAKWMITLGVISVISVAVFAATVPLLATIAAAITFVAFYIAAENFSEAKRIKSLQKFESLVEACEKSFQISEEMLAPEIFSLEELLEKIEPQLDQIAEHLGYNKQEIKFGLKFGREALLLTHIGSHVFSLDLSIKQLKKDLLKGERISRKESGIDYFLTKLNQSLLSTAGKINAHIDAFNGAKLK